MNDHLNVCTDTGQCLIHRIIHYLIYQMMQSFDGGAADIHTGSFPDCFQTFQDLNLIRTIFQTFTAHIFFHLDSPEIFFFRA